MNAVQKLRQMVGEVRRSPGAQASWDLVGRLLSRMPADQSEVARVCAERDVEALDRLVARLENPEAPADMESPAQQFSEEVLDHALRVFKKRLKVTVLAEESKLGGRQLTAGRKSAIAAIAPPHEIPNEVWAALVRDGRLKDAGHGFLSLP